MKNQEEFRYEVFYFQTSLSMFQVLEKKLNEGAEIVRVDVIPPIPDVNLNGEGHSGEMVYILKYKK